jgi:hypothetical protein
VDFAALALACALLHGGAVAQFGREPLLRRVEEAFSDRDPLASSLRQIDVDLRQPAGFNALYQVEGKEVFIRRAGAVWAVFPRGRYTRHDGKTVVQAPAGMTFSIGPPSALLTEPKPQKIANPARMELALPSGGVHPAADRRVDQRLDHRADEAQPQSGSLKSQGAVAPPLPGGEADERDGRSLPVQQVAEGADDELAPSGLPSLAGDPPPRFLGDERYRRERLSAMLERLRIAEPQDGTEVPTPR